MTSTSVRVLLVCLVLVSGFKPDLKKGEAALVGGRASSQKTQVAAAPDRQGLSGKLANHVAPYILRRVIAAVLLGALYLRVYREEGSWDSFRDVPLRFMGAPSVEVAKLVRSLELWLKKQTQKFMFGPENLKLQLDLVDACAANDVWFVKDLIKKGAKPEVLSEKIDLWTTASPFNTAVDGGYLEVVRALVQDGGLKVTSSHLAYAVEKQKKEIVLFVLDLILRGSDGYVGPDVMKVVDDNLKNLKLPENCQWKSSWWSTNLWCEPPRENLITGSVPLNLPAGKKNVVSEILVSEKANKAGKDPLAPSVEASEAKLAEERSAKGVSGEKVVSEAGRLRTEKPGQVSGQMSENPKPDIGAKNIQILPYEDFQYTAFPSTLLKLLGSFIVIGLVTRHLDVSESLNSIYPPQFLAIEPPRNLDWAVVPYEPRWSE